MSHVYPPPLYEAGIEVDFVNPTGGSTYAYGVDVGNPATQWHSTLLQIFRPDEEYDAVYYVGGHGTLWDLPNDTKFNQPFVMVPRNW